MWAIATLAHLANQSLGFDVDFGLSVEGVLAVLLVFACGFALYRADGLSHLIMASAQIAYVMGTAPFAADHWLMVALTNLAYVVAYIAERPKADYPVSFAEAARLVFLVTYGAAFLAKLNTGFFDPQTSCAVFLYNHLSQVLPLPPPLAWLAIPLTIAAEGLVAIGLWHRRTARWAIQLGAFFHFALAASPAVRVFDFSCTVFAFMFLFSSENAPVVLDGFRARLGRAGELLGRYRAIWIGALCVFVAFASPILVARFPTLKRPFSTALVVAFLVYGMGFCLWMIRAHNRPMTARRKKGGLTPATLASVPLAVLLAISPYIGLRTVGAFTMYSNVRTELGTSNHLLLPRLRLFKLQDDLVEIVSSDDPGLAELANEGEVVHFVMLHRHVNDFPGIEVEYVRDGEHHIHTPDSPDPDLVEPLSWWLQVYYLGRPVPKVGAPRCQN